MSLSLAGTADSAIAAALLRRAEEFGINLVDAGRDSAEIAGTRRILAGAESRFHILYEFAGAAAAGQAAAEFADFLDRTNGGESGFLAIRIPDAARFEQYREGGFFDLAADARRNGRLGHLGFSCPPDPALAMAVADGFEGWDFFRADYSFLDSAFVPAIRHAAGREIGFIASNPFAGGYLENAPPAVHELYYRAPVPRSHGEWALRGIWEMQETVTVVLAPKNGEGLIGYAILAEAGRPNSLTGKELAVLESARKVSANLSPNP